MTRYCIVMPLRFAARYQREPGFDPFPEMGVAGVVQCRRLMVQRERQGIALNRWHMREIDNTKD